MDGIPLLRACMSFRRFKQIKQHIRFDDPLRRDRDDPLAPVRHLVEQFNASLRLAYKPGAFLCVDEMLLEYHGRVKFRQYIPTKPGKFGIKLFWIVDADNAFPLQCLVYIGEKTLSPEEKAAASSIPEAIVRALVLPHLGEGRCVTSDNYFTSLALSEFLLQNITTYVGTIRNNRRELPPAAKSTRNRQRGDTVHFYSDKASLCSFWDKGKNPVLLLSTMHFRQLPNASDGKSDIVVFYNSTKAGVDTLDKLTRTYRSQRKCNRWPYGVFFTLADTAVIGGLTMLRETTGDPAISHYEFKKQLAYQLCLPLVHERAAIPRLPVSVRAAMTLIGVHRLPPVHPAAEKKSRCHYCPRSMDKKTSKTCSACEKHMCEAHRSGLCTECSMNY